MMRKQTAILVMLIVSLCSEVHGMDYFVSTTGKDSNPGTEKAPFATIKHAFNVHPGDVSTTAAFQKRLVDFLAKQ